LAICTSIHCRNTLENSRKENNEEKEEEGALPLPDEVLHCRPD
jgi:hypothetical protein